LPNGDDRPMHQLRRRVQTHGRKVFGAAHRPRRLCGLRRHAGVLGGKHPCCHFRIGQTSGPNAWMMLRLVGAIRSRLRRRCCSLVVARHSRPKDGVASARLRPGDPVRRGLSTLSLPSLEYWVARSSRAMTTSVCWDFQTRIQKGRSPRGQALLSKLTAQSATVSVPAAVGAGLVARVRPEPGPARWHTEPGSRCLSASLW
jgi:hypothetical protein